MWFWSIVIIVCSAYTNLWAEVDGIYSVNMGDGIPSWIFTPEIIIISPIMATVLRYAVFAQKRDNERRRNLREMQ